MSIVRLLIRISVVEAWRGRTTAQGNVFDSRIDTLDGLLKGKAAPVLIFSIEEGEDADAGQHDGLVGRDSRLTAMVQAAVASGREVRSGDGSVLVLEIGETDAAYEALLDILSWQWRVCLSDNDNPWAQIFRGLVVSVGTIKDQRAFDQETGTKHASRFWQFEVTTLPEPMPGDALAEPIEAGLSLMEEDAEYAPLAATWRQLLSEGAGLSDLEHIQAALFATHGDMNALGHGPLIGDAGEFTEAVIEISGAETMVISDDP